MSDLTKTDSSLVERLLGYAESGFATDHKTDCATAAYELVALAADRDAARDVYLTLQQSSAVLASRISTLERELEEARALVIEANNSLYGSQGYFYSLNGGPFDKYHLSTGIENLKSACNSRWHALTAAEAKIARMGEALKEWAEARRATLADPVADVRKSESFRSALNRLSNAEEALARSALQSEKDREGEDGR